MMMTDLSLRENLRIIWAIAAKDIGDAMKNKHTIGIIPITLALVLIYRLIPQFTEVSGLSTPTVLIYDEGDSTLVEALEDSPALEAYEFGSQVIMEEELAFAGDKNELALVIPANFDEALEASGQPVLDGYVLHWLSGTQAKEIRELVEEEVERWAGKRIQIDLEGNVVYSLPDSFGFPVWGSLSIMYVVLMIGVTLTPHLVLEEKQNKSIDALLVSPANSSHIVIGKALTGLFYCFTGAAIALALNAILVTHWWLVILTVILGSLFSTALGLLLGTIFENRQQLTVWAMPVFAVLLIPVFIAILPRLLPQKVLDILAFIPTIAMEKVIRISFSEMVAFSQIGLSLAIIAGYALLFFVILRWALQRSDR
jgi:ABC-2 type transport system permease protein